MAMASWVMLNGGTLGVQTTPVVHAWILTQAVYASRIATAVGVGSTFRLGTGVRVAVDVRIANIATRALADAPVILNTALGSVSTRVCVTRADATPV